MAPSKRPTNPPNRSSKPSTLPKSWPPSLQHLTSPSLSPHIPASTLTSLSLTHPNPTPPSALVRIRPITTPAHPACGQSGLFATKKLARNTHLLDYLGRYHTSADVDATSDYDIWLDRELDVAIDAATCGNEGRFVNDYRGVAGRENVEFRVYRREGGETRLGIWTCREVGKGDECLVSYGKGFWEGRKEAEVEEGSGG